MRRLIINADDFGLTSGVNRAILEAHQHGVVTSATLMGNGGAADDAVVRARQLPDLGLGAHLVLIDGAPVLEKGGVASLTVPATGRFYDGWLAFASRALRGRFRPEEIRAEAEAQIRRLQNAGLALTHVDSHKHVHLLPPILKPLLGAAKACGIRAIRNPFAPVKPLAMAHLLRRPRLWKRYSEVGLLRRFRRDFREAVAAEGMLTTDGTFGIVVTGALNDRLFAAIVGSIPEGTWELVCHPGYCDDALRRTTTRLLESRAQELKVLTSPAARDAIAAAGIELISYAQLGKPG